MVVSTKIYPVRLRRFQFSLSMLLATTVLVAVVLGLWLAARRRAEFQSRPGRFSQGVKRGDLAEVDRLLKLEPQLAQGCERRGFSSSHTPLQVAMIFGGTPQVVERILKERPDLNERADDGNTALHLVVQHRKYPYVARLLQLDADPNIANWQGESPLHLAATFDADGQLMKLLLDSGADPNKAQEWDIGRHQGMRPLHLAAQNGKSAAIKHLLDAGADVNGRDALGRTPLHLAMARNFEVCRELIARGADLTAKDQAGQIPGEFSEGTNSETAATIWWEIIVRCHDQKRVAELDKLLDAAPQALSFQPDYWPKSMLARAVAENRLDVLTYLLSRRLQIDEADLNAALHGACLHTGKSIEFAQKLLDAGASITAQSDAWNKAPRSPLHTAASSHNHAAIELLIARGADVRARDKAGTTVMDAAFENSFHLPQAHKTLELLRQAGHSPTVLYAAASGEIELLRKLAVNGSELLSGLLDKPYNSSGVHPLHAAVLGNQPATERWLLAQRVNCDPVLSGTWGYAANTPLMLALSYDKTEMAILLLEHGAEVNRKDRHGRYPAHAAVGWERDPKILEALLAHGADVTLKYENQTVLELARASRSKHQPRYLELLQVNRGKQTAAGRPAQ